MDTTKITLKLPVIKETIEVAAETPAPTIIRQGAATWLAPYVCSGKLRSGAFPGNIYHNNGRVYITTLRPKANSHITTEIGAALPPLRRMFPALSDAQIAERIEGVSPDNPDFDYTIEGDYLLFHNIPENGIGLFIRLRSSDSFMGRGIDGRYITIGKEGLLRTFDYVSLPHFRHNPVTVRDIKKYVHIQGGRFICKFPKRYEVQFLLRKRCNKRHTVKGGIQFVKYDTDGLMEFQHKIRPKYNSNVYLIARVARKNRRRKYHSKSEWSYFRTIGYEGEAKVVPCYRNGAMHSASYLEGIPD